MKEKEFYDIIIAGAGPAGLSLGAELSKNFKVLIIEKGKIGVTNKSWLTYEDRIKKIGFPKSCIVNKFKKWHFNYQGAECIINDTYVTVDEKKVLDYWINICKKNKVTLIEKCPFLSVRKKNDFVIVNNDYKSALFIDCCGVDSIIVKKKRLIEDIVYLNCYGAYVKTKKKEKNYYTFLNKIDGIYNDFGVTKLGSDIYFVLYFMYSENKLDLNKYKNRFNNTYKKLLDKNGKIIEYKVAHYATGKLKQHTFDNIYLFGDAGLLCPGFIGMGFNEILRQHKAVAKHLSKCLNEGRLSQKELETPVSVLQDAESIFFRAVSQSINTFDKETLKILLGTLGKINNKTLQRMFRNTITREDMIKFLSVFLKKLDLNEVIKRIPKRHIIKFLKGLLKLSEDLIFDEIHDLVYKHHKIKVKDLL